MATIAALPQHTSDRPVQQHRREREGAQAIHQTLDQGRALHAFTRVRARIEETLAEILPHRVVLLVGNADVRSANESHPIPTQRVVQVILPLPSLGYFAVSLEQLARIDDVVTGEPRRWAGGEWRDAMTVLAEEGCPIHQSLRRRIVHRSTDD